MYLWLCIYVAYNVHYYILSNFCFLVKGFSSSASSLEDWWWPTYVYVYTHIWYNATKRSYKYSSYMDNYVSDHNIDVDQPKFTVPEYKHYTYNMKDIWSLLVYMWAMYKNLMMVYTFCYKSWFRILIIWNTT